MQVALTSDDTDLMELAKIARMEPVILQQEDQDVAVILSASDYKRLTQANWDDFDELCADLSAEAIANGLTEDKLAEILAEIDAETPR